MTGDMRVQLSEDDANPARLDELTGFLRAELLQLDIEDVTALRAGPPPPGARVFDVLAVGGLLVSLTGSTESLLSVVSAIRNWLVRGKDTQRTVRLEIDGDALELSTATEADQERLITMFLARHSTMSGRP